ncbi:MAG: ABC transporter ATP-binding protein [Anaerolineales bacterium]|nr:ABC transporter ATP-binding protein [Anaerolineales bacterium]
MRSAEFSAPNQHHYDRRSIDNWIVSHLWRYRWRLLLVLAMYGISSFAFSAAPMLIGSAVGSMLDGNDVSTLVPLALGVLVVLVMDGGFNLIGAMQWEYVAKRFSADARGELYASLLEKNQVFHNRQRAGDLMARATDDVGLLSDMVTPGMSIILETVLFSVAPLVFLSFTDPQLLLVPLLFFVVYAFAVRAYMRELEPVVERQRVQFGELNAKLEETISGIETVKASAQEPAERQKVGRLARLIRDSFAAQGTIEARYLPLLLYAVTLGLQFLHALWRVQAGAIGVADVITVMGLMAVLRWPTFASIFTFSIVQAGRASAGRILSVIKAHTDLDQNLGGHTEPIRGEIVFEHVTYGSADHAATAGPLLRDVSFTVEPGQTVAIVGQTGSGKSSLTQLINRTYDATEGRVLIDGVDVRAWSLDALRSQISKIEQDIFLFSRSIGENIAFGRPGATPADIEAAARAAQAHDFIMKTKDGYATVIGERGMTLSGGQRQRIALARAFLADPRILILDDSTSAIDSATEDEIQKAIRGIQHGRTTLLITHRLSQIRWADTIVVLDAGRIEACGKHEDLLRSSVLYRRIFARYEGESVGAGANLKRMARRPEAATPAGAPPAVNPQITDA